MWHESGSARCDRRFLRSPGRDRVIAALPVWGVALPFTSFALPRRFSTDTRPRAPHRRHAGGVAAGSSAARVRAAGQRRRDRAGFPWAGESLAVRWSGRQRGRPDRSPAGGGTRHAHLAGSVGTRPPKPDGAKSVSAARALRKLGARKPVNLSPHDGRARPALQHTNQPKSSARGTGMNNQQKRCSNVPWAPRRKRTGRPVAIQKTVLHRADPRWREKSRCHAGASKGKGARRPKRAKKAEAASPHKETAAQPTMLGHTRTAQTSPGNRVKFRR